MARVVVSLPPKAKRGEIIEIKTLAGHPMETGFRRTQLGELIPRDIITRFTCSYNGVEIFSADLHPAMAANPLIAFTTVATESGTLEFRWTGDNGFSVTQSAAITVV
jgi:sulfur-oxidizing protein SoxZ